MPPVNSPRRALPLLIPVAVLLVCWIAYRLASPPSGGEAEAVDGEEKGRSRLAAPAETPRTGNLPPEHGTDGTEAQSGATGSSLERRKQLVAAAAERRGRDLELLITGALRDPDVELRREALALSADLVSEELDKAVLPVVLQDDDARLRDLAVQRVNQLPVARRIEFFEGALYGARDDMATLAAQWLAALGGKNAVHALMSAWPRADSALRATAIRKALQRLTGHEFAGAPAAAAWWAEAAPDLDQDLLPLAR